jgi:hypothetical protein
MLLPLLLSLITLIYLQSQLNIERLCALIVVNLCVALLYVFVAFVEPFLEQGESDVKALIAISGVIVLGSLVEIAAVTLKVLWIRAPDCKEARPKLEQRRS